MTIQDPLITLGLPLPPPAPVPGCDVCEALDRQRSAALAAGNRSGATDCNVEIRDHPHPKRKAGTS